MQATPLLITTYALIPMTIALLGGFIATLWTPKKGIQNFLEHFVAGVVIAAVAIELLPKIVTTPSWTMLIGFVIGVAAMLLLHELAHYLSDRKGKSAIPFGLIGAAIVDLFVDGLLIGVSFLAGFESGVFIAISLSLCAFFLTLSVASKLKKKRTRCLATLCIALALPLGALVGSSVIAQFPPYILTETLAFGVAALLFLGTEELLGEAHREKETPLITSAFFLGFLFILLFKIH